MKRKLVTEVFLGIVVVALLSVGIVGLVARSSAEDAFRAYLLQLPSPRGMMGGVGQGRQMVLTGAEQAFVTSLDRSILFGSLAAFGLAALAAALLAYYLTRPLKRLTGAANAVAQGDLGHRVEVAGPVEIERLGDAFNDMAASLSEAEDLRRRLVADVAHELRNPIAGLRAQVEGIAEGVLPANEARMASLVDDTVYLSRLVDDLQELSTADAGQLSYDMQRLDLCAIVEHEVKTAVLRAQPAVTVRSSCDGSTWVEGDEGRLRQVIRNLLDNALRHTEAGSIDVVCHHEGQAAVVEVLDTGEGIPEADLPYVFERFYRADAVRARRTGGAGIGLSIARRIVEDHRGSVFAGNRDDGGAIVGFSVPLAVADGPPSGPSE